MQPSLTPEHTFRTYIQATGRRQLSWIRSRALTKNWSCWHPDPGLVSLQNSKKMFCCFSHPSHNILLSQSKWTKTPHLWLSLLTGAREFILALFSKYNFFCQKKASKFSFRRKKTLIQKSTCHSMFLAALFTIIKTLKQPKCPLTVEDVNM